MSKSLLILGKGDTAYADRNAKRLFEYAKEAGFEVERRDYTEIEKASDFRNETVNIVFFFPHLFWNENCEIPRDTGLYGTSEASYRLFKGLFLEAKEILQKKYAAGHKLNYLISPESAALDRDKIVTIQKLKGFGVPTSEMIPYRNLDNILNNLTRERGVFIKCRYGAEGKGLTLLREGKWMTNYKVEKSRLTNHGIYGYWGFTEITGRKDLLEQLLEQEVIVEKEVIVPRLFGDKKFDARAYVVKGLVPHLFTRVNSPEKVVTNYSQGGRILHHPESGLLAEFVEQIKKEAVKSAQVFESVFLGVDVMFDGQADNVRVIEVQTFTDFPDIRVFDLARYLIKKESGLFF